MAVLVMKNPKVRIGTSAAPVSSTDVLLQKRIRSVTLNLRAEILDKTAFGSSGRNRIPGLKDGSLTIEFINDYVDNGVDEIINSKLGLESSNCWIEVRPTTAARGAGNPAYTGWYCLESYNPGSGTVGDLGVVTANFVAGSAIVRRTA